MTPSSERIVTVIMPVLDAARTLPAVLVALGRGCADVPVRLMVCDNGSTDGTNEYLASDEFDGLMRGMGIEAVVLEPVPSKTGHFKDFQLREVNLQHMMAKFAFELAERDTPKFVFSLSSDILMPDGGMLDLLAEMQRHPTLGAIGFKYHPDSDHVRRGCTLYRWAAFQELAALGFPMSGCVCRGMCEELEKLGWKTRHTDRYGVHLTRKETDDAKE
jgi:hypothetical protein